MQNFGWIDSTKLIIIYSCLKISTPGETGASVVDASKMSNSSILALFSNSSANNKPSFPQQQNLINQGSIHDLQANISAFKI